MFTSERGGFRTAVRVAVAGVATLLLIQFAAFDSDGGERPNPAATTLAPAGPETASLEQSLADSGVDSPLTFVYYFYWYDSASGLHLSPTDPLPNHPTAEPVTSYASPEWHRRQLSDMTEALIDVVLPVYWGDSPAEPWSTAGLDALVQARQQLVAEAAPAPAIGMFYDTSILRGLDLTTAEGREIFYEHIGDFFARIPREHWALVDGRPVVWLFAPQDNRWDQQTFDFAEDQFEARFGVAPFVVRDVAWTDVTTAASFPWGTAQNGVQATDLVVSVGPGYDERQVPGRTGVFRPREEGAWYRRNLQAALASGRPLLAIETWNEFHEASGIGESVEYGRTYIDLTRELIGAHRAAGG